MLSQTPPALVSLGIFTLLTGLLYPLVVTGLAQVPFRGGPTAASLSGTGRRSARNLLAALHDRNILGAALSDESCVLYAFQCREANRVIRLELRPTQSSVVRGRAGAYQALQEADPQHGPHPGGPCYPSGSGLDPPSVLPLPPTGGRVARARGNERQAVRQVVAQHTEGRTFGLLGEPRVNVLAANLPRSAMISRPHIMQAVVNHGTPASRVVQRNTGRCPPLHVHRGALTWRHVQGTLRI